MKTFHSIDEYIKTQSNSLDNLVQFIEKNILSKIYNDKISYDLVTKELFN